MIYYAISQSAAWLETTLGWDGLIGSGGLVVLIIGPLLMVSTGALSVAIEWVNSR